MMIPTGTAHRNQSCKNLLINYFFIRLVILRVQGSEFRNLRDFEGLAAAPAGVT